MSSSSSRAWFLPGSRSRSVATAILLAAFVILAVTLINQRYFFHDTAYESGDQAANSLDVLRCKKFEDYLGAYSRWSFHHPGPFLFYCYAAGEAIFWQGLHLTRTPLNAQVLSLLCVTASFFAIGVALAARWLRSAFFVPLAALFSALHYTSVHLKMCVLDTWPPYAAPLPYFCLLLAAASVGAGQGEDLPWLMLAGCVLIHIHVGNPLFVVPLFVVAYAGLLAACRGAWPVPGQEVASAMWPWRRYPRAHVVAGVLGLLFFLPIAIDLAHGVNSNFALILHHLRTHQGEHHAYLDAVYYLLRFATYKPSVIGNVKVFDGTQPATIYHLLFTHLLVVSLWTGALLSPLLALALRAGLRPVSSETAEPADELLDRPRWRFLAWLAGCWALCVPLALFWAHIQDGEMLYYNAWYLYSLFGVLAIIGAAALSDMLERVVRRFNHPRALTWTGALLLLLAAAAVLLSPLNPARNHAYLGDFDNRRALARSVFNALAQHPDAPRTKLLVIPDNAALGSAPAVALLLVRSGYAVRVLPAWKYMLGFQNTLPESWLQDDPAYKNQPPMETWWIVPSTPQPGIPVDQPPVDDFALKVGLSEIDPARTSTIFFGHPQRNCDAYALLGFEQSDPGCDWTWTLGQAGRLDFKSRPVPPQSVVELAFDFWPPLINGTTHPAQRLEVQYNQTSLGTMTVTANTPPDSLRVRLPAALWNAHPTGSLYLGFPDAAAPAVVSAQSQDPRLLGFTAKKITFRLVDPAGAGTAP